MEDETGTWANTAVKITFSDAGVERRGAVRWRRRSELHGLAAASDATLMTTNG